MARLIELHAENLLAFEDARLPLARQGLVFISGVNMDSDAASSNGACKTGLFKALGWTLYGKAVDKEDGDKMIRKGTKCGRGTIRIEDGDDVYEVIRERRKQSPKLFIEKNDERIKASKADLQEIINRLMGVDWHGFINTAMYAQRDRARFVDKTTKDADRKDVLHSILRTGIFKFCHVESKARKLALVKEREQYQDQVASLTTRIDDHDLDAIQELIAEFDKESSELAKELAAKAKALTARAKAARGSVDVAPLEAKADALKADRRANLHAVSKAKADRSQAATDYRTHNAAMAGFQGARSAAASSIALLEGDSCPTCTGPLTKGHGKAHRRALKARVTELEDSITEAQAARQRASQAEERADTEVDRLDEERESHAEALATVQGQIDTANAAKQRATDLADQARTVIADARSMEKRDNPHAKTLAAAKKKIKELKRERKAARTARKATDPMLAALEFWTRGFGPTGIPSFALDSVMPFLTERANHYLETLSDGDISINFSTQRELASGDEYRDEIGITWWIEGIEDVAPSGGQWKKMEIATNFAMMDLVATREGSHVNILCLDECLDGLDGEGRQRVVKLLHDLRSVRESIFVISHDPGFAEIFERTVTVTKENGVSRLAA